MTHQSVLSSNVIIKEVFTSLNNNSIQYVVLRNYDGLPDVVGHDIDLLVEEESLDLFIRIFNRVIRDNGWISIQIQNRFCFVSFIVTPVSHEHSPFVTLKWDIWAPITFNGIPWIDAKKILVNRKLYSGLFFIPTPGAESATLLLKDLIQGKIIKPVYFNRIRSFYLADPKQFKSVLTGAFSTDITDELGFAIQNENFDSIERKSSQLKKVLVKQSITVHPLSTFFCFIRFITGHLKDYLNGRNRVFICFIGPDGSGKSTISQMVIQSIQDVFADVQYFHGHFAILPPLSSIHSGSKNKPKKQEARIRNRKGKILGKIPASLMMMYYSLDYILGFFWIFICRRKFDFVIFDRYFYDYIIQPIPFTLQSPLYRFLLALIPKPDIVIFLQSSAEIIYQRKPELSIPELTRQIDICNQVVQNLEMAYTVDNTQPKDIVVQMIRRRILEVLIKNAKEIYG